MGAGTSRHRKNLVISIDESSVSAIMSKLLYNFKEHFPSRQFPDQFPFDHDYYHEKAVALSQEKPLNLLFVHVALRLMDVYPVESADLEHYYMMAIKASIVEDQKNSFAFHPIILYQRYIFGNTRELLEYFRGVRHYDQMREWRPAPIYGIKLFFLYDFISKYHINPEMTCGDVLHKIILPATRQNRQSFVQSELAPHFPEYVTSDVNWVLHESAYPKKSYVVCEWDMPFVLLVKFLLKWCMEDRQQIADIPNSAAFLGDTRYLDLYNCHKYCSIYSIWLDIFCENFHQEKYADLLLRTARAEGGLATIPVGGEESIVSTSLQTGGASSCKSRSSSGLKRSPEHLLEIMEFCENALIVLWPPNEPFRVLSQLEGFSEEIFQSTPHPLGFYLSFVAEGYLLSGSSGDDDATAIPNEAVSLRLQAISKAIIQKLKEEYPCRIQRREEEQQEQAASTANALITEFDACCSKLALYAKSLFDEAFELPAWMEKVSACFVRDLLQREYFSHFHGLSSTDAPLIRSRQILVRDLNRHLYLSNLYSISLSWMDLNGIYEYSDLQFITNDTHTNMQHPGVIASIDTMRRKFRLLCSDARFFELILRQAFVLKLSKEHLHCAMEYMLGTRPLYDRIHAGSENEINPYRYISDHGIKNPSPHYEVSAAEDAAAAMVEAVVEAVLNTKTNTTDPYASLEFNSKEVPFEECNDPPLYGVSLAFLLYFIEKYEIPPDMTTGEVVQRFIVPQTIFTQKTYVETHLVGRYDGSFCIDMRPKVRLSGRSYSFVSHPWQMPFQTLVSIIKQHILRDLEDRYTYNGMGFDSKHNEEAAYFIMGSDYFYWIDIFSKNQHVPAPAMEEFRYALKTPGVVLVALWPSKNPICLNRIWCLYEIWTAIMMKLKINICFHDAELSKEVIERRNKQIFSDTSSRKKQIFIQKVEPSDFTLPIVASLMEELVSFDVLQSTATFKYDIELIMGMIESSIGAEAMNAQIRDLIANHMLDDVKWRTQDRLPSCFDGLGKIRMGDDQLKLVKDLQVGDMVFSKDTRIEGDQMNHSQGAKVILITKDAIKSEDTELCWINGLYLTPEHPIWENDLPNNLRVGEEKDVESSLTSTRWVLPKDICLPTIEHDGVDFVYNIELEEGYHCVEINELTVLTLGHDLDVDPDTDRIWGWGWKDNPQRDTYFQTEN